MPQTPYVFRDHLLVSLCRHFWFGLALQVQVLKQKVHAAKGDEYYAEGLKLIFSGMPIP